MSKQKSTYIVFLVAIASLLDIETSVAGSGAFPTTLAPRREPAGSMRHGVPRRFLEANKPGVNGLPRITMGQSAFCVRPKTARFVPLVDSEPAERCHLTPNISPLFGGPLKRESERVRAPAEGLPPVVSPIRPSTSGRGVHSPTKQIANPLSGGTPLVPLAGRPASGRDDTQHQGEQLTPEQIRAEQKRLENIVHSIQDRGPHKTPRILCEPADFLCKKVSVFTHACLDQGGKVNGVFSHKMDGYWIFPCYISIKKITGETEKEKLSNLQNTCKEIEGVHYSDSLLTTESEKGKSFFCWISSTKP